MINKLRQLGDTPLTTCVIVRGELIFMAQKSEQKVQNLHQVHQFLNDILVYPIDDQTANIYGTLKAAILDRFGPREKAKRRKTETTQLGFSENDLWIAAIARRYALTIVSADDDFERIKQVEDISVERWWSPELD